MKKLILGSILTASFLFASSTIQNNDKGCIENLESEVVKIVNSDMPQNKKQKEIESIKVTIQEGVDGACESNFEDEIRKIIYGNQKKLTKKVIIKHAKKAQKKTEDADINAQDCIENFEAEVLKIINSNPNNKNIEETKQIMHEIMHKKVVESCESEFEAETKKIVNGK
ncbi:hypothetical protein [Sulfurimonas sp.]|uniref:hypothetical protein n=1 Tax=Sulfurimonas sp. TaxID=2022749 RepID=UPI002623250B|nr:hypothetical protein [Sulfurimonas sp.]